VPGLLVEGVTGECQRRAAFAGIAVSERRGHHHRHVKKLEIHLYKLWKVFSSSWLGYSLSQPSSACVKVKSSGWCGAATRRIP